MITDDWKPQTRENGVLTTEEIRLRSSYCSSSGIRACLELLICANEHNGEIEVKELHLLNLRFVFRLFNLNSAGHCFIILSTLTQTDINPIYYLLHKKHHIL